MPGISLQDYLTDHNALDELAKTSPLAQWLVEGRGLQIAQPKAPAPEPAPFKRGLLGVASDLTEAGGVAANYLGAFDFAAAAYEKAKEYAASRDAIPRRVAAIEDIHSAADAGVWAYETLAENVPNLLALALPGGGVGLGARLAGAGIGAAKGLGTAAAFLTDLGLQTGESASAAQEAGGSPADIKVLGTGLGKALLDFTPVVVLAKQLGLAKTLESNLLRQFTEGGYLKRSATNAMELIATEVPTEVAQQALDIALKRTIQQRGGALSEEEKSELLNAGAGAATFGLFGFVSGVRNRSEAPGAGATPPPPLGPTSTPTASEATLTPESAPAIKLPAKLDEEKKTTVVDPTPGIVVGPPPVTKIPGWSALPNSSLPFYALDYDPTKDIGNSFVVFVKDAWQAHHDLEHLGEYATREEAQLVVERAVASPNMTLITPEGTQAIEAKTPKLQQLQALPEEKRTPTENAEVQIENAVPSPAPVEDSNPVPQVEPTINDPGMQKLMDIRTELLSNEENFRTKDGNLRKNAQAKVMAVETRIEALAKSLGIPSPLATGVRVVDEADLKPVPPPRAIVGLTDAETALLGKLEEREMLSGLSPREYENLSALYDKRDGAERAQRFSKATSAIAGMRQEKAIERLLAGPKKLSEFTLLSVKDRLEWRAPPTGEREILAVLHEKENPRQPLGAVIRVPNGGFSAYVKDVGLLPEVYASPREAAQVVEAHGKSRLGYSTQEQVAEWIRPFIDATQNHPDIFIARNDNSDLLTEDQLEAVAGPFVRGALFGGPSPKIVLFNNNVRNEKDAVLTVLHEMVHYGLRGLMPRPQVIDLLRAIYRTRHADVQNFADVQEKGYSGLPSLTKEEIEVADFNSLIRAEEYVTRLAEEAYSGNPLEPFELSILDRVVNVIRRWLRGIYRNLTFTDKEITGVLRNLGTAMRGENKQNNSPPQAATFTALRKVVPGPLQEEAVAGLESFLGVWSAKTKGALLTPIQYAERSGSVAAKGYLDVVRAWWARKRALADESLKAASDWSKLGRRQAGKLTEAIFEIEAKSSELERRLTGEEVVEILRSKDLGEGEAQIYKAVDENFRRVLDYVQRGVEISTIQRFLPGQDAYTIQKEFKENRDGFLRASEPGDSRLALAAKLTEIETQFAAARNRNYFPHMRFGKYAVTVRAAQDTTIDGKEYAAGQVVHFETSESYAGRKERLGDLRREFHRLPVEFEAGILKDEEFSLLGMPPALIDVIGETLSLTKEQQQTLKDLYVTKSPGMKFMRQFLRRQNVAGFSQDAIRVYSSYMTSAANHIARIEFQQPLQDQLSAMRREKGDVAGLVFNYFNKHYSYIMKPGNELAALRSVGFLFYLGLNVKSALVNLTQVPMVAYPFLATHYGDKAAIGALTAAYKAGMQWKRGELTPTNPRLVAAITRGISEGFLDESRATELAALGEAGVLERLGPANKSEQLLATASRYGAAMFKWAEVYNRTVTFIAAYELASRKGLVDEAAFREARRAVDATMFEYAKWNRPEFMRGKKSVVFLFWNYMQHLSYLFFGGEGKQMAMRMGLMMLVAAGIEGLPFAENILDMLDWSGTQMKEALGMENPRVDLRTSLRELALAITDRPDLVMNGLSKYYGLGPAHALGLVGVPVPDVNVSGSLSAGQVIPGMKELLGPERDPNAKLGRTLVEMLGPVMGIGFGFFKAMESDEPDKWKRWERAMPSAFKMASQAARRGLRGEETDKNGNPVLKFQWTDSEQRGELVANALGFQPTRISQQYEVIGVQQELKQYWTARRAVVMENFAFAVLSKEPEAIADAREALRRFNAQTPSPTLRITGEGILRSLRARTRVRALREAGIPNERAFIPLYRNLESAYPVVEEAANLPEQALEQAR